MFSAKNKQINAAWFMHFRSFDGSVIQTSDNLTGDGDEEQIIVKLNALSPQYHKILFVATIYEGLKKIQHFGMLDNAFIRAVNAKGKEMVKFILSGKTSFNQKRSVVFAKLYRCDSG
jgi:stress response protein SCP2